MCSFQRFRTMHLCSLFVSLPIWISFIPVAILNGGFRDYVLVKFLPDKCALAVSGIILSILILLVAKILLSRVKKLSRTDFLVISFVWILLTVLFDHKYRKIIILFLRLVNKKLRYIRRCKPEYTGAVYLYVRRTGILFNLCF